MKTTITAVSIALIIVATLSGCCNSSLCNEHPPLEGRLEVKVNPDNLAQGVPVTIYNGDNWETGDTVWHGYVVSIFDTVVLTDRTYSGTAVYDYGGETITVVDEAEVKVKERNCEETCYKVKDGTLNLELRRDAG